MTAALVTGDLLTGLGQLVSDLGCLVIDSQVVPVFYKVVPPEPDLLLCLTSYGINDDPILGHSTVSVQFWARSRQSQYNDADDLLDQIYYQLQNLPGQTLPGGVVVAMIGRTSTMPLGLDTRGRLERSDNYDVLTVAPLVNRP